MSKCKCQKNTHIVESLNSDQGLPTPYEHLIQSYKEQSLELAQLKIMLFRIKLLLEIHPKDTTPGNLLDAIADEIDCLNFNTHRIIESEEFEWPI